MDWNAYRDLERAETERIRQLNLTVTFAGSAVLQLQRVVMLLRRGFDSGLCGADVRDVEAVLSAVVLSPISEQITADDVVQKLRAERRRMLDEVGI